MFYQNTRSLSSGESGLGLTPQRDELQPFVPALDRLLEHRADATHVELVVEDSGLERRPFLRQQGLVRRHVRNADRGAETEDLEVIVRMAPVELLPASLADRRVGGHVDPGHGAVPAAL